MFIYAAAKGLGVKNNKYCLSDISELKKYFHLTAQDKYLNLVKYLYFRIKNKILPYRYFHFQDNFIDYSKQLIKKKSKDSWFYGYFQSETYFSDSFKEIKTAFQLKKHLLNRFIDIKTQFDNKPFLVVHVRLRDYKTFGPEYLNGPDMTLPYTYYRNILNDINIDKYNLVFTSDDISEVEKEFSDYKSAFFSHYDKMIDFQFIKNAQVNIISHSTFAWWAAWLNEESNKKIYVPKYFLGFKIKQEYPLNIIPKDWIENDVH
jgi:hypothetical protein